MHTKVSAFILPTDVDTLLAITTQDAEAPSLLQL